MNNVHFSSEKDDWETPQYFFNELNEHFNFKRDLASSEDNHKCDIYFTKETNVLEKDWNSFDGWNFLNPPYGRELKKWVKKASESKAKIVMLIPARTDTSYWHEYIFNKADVYFLRGRLKFEINGKPHYPAPFPSAVVIFNKGE